MTSAGREQGGWVLHTYVDICFHERSMWLRDSDSWLMILLLAWLWCSSSRHPVWR